MTYPLASRYQRLVIFGIVLLALIQIVSNFSDASKEVRRPSVVLRVLNFLLYPVESAVAVSVRAAGELSGRYLWLVGVAEENQRLQSRIDLLAQELHRMKELEIENQRLLNQLDFKQRSPYRLIAARVHSRDFNADTKTLIIDKGTTDGVQSGMAVISLSGVVGRVVLAYPHNSEVLLVTDASFTIDATVQRSRSNLILTGASWQYLRVKYIERRDPLEVGDLLITSGLSGIFPKGLAIGIVDALKADPHELIPKARIRPSADLSRLEELFVVDLTK